MNDFEKIIAYGRELGIENADVDDFIASHRSLRSLRDNAITNQKILFDMLESERKRAYQQVLDSSWIRIEDLKKMSIKELVLLLQDD